MSEDELCFFPSRFIGPSLLLLFLQYMTQLGFCWKAAGSLCTIKEVKGEKKQSKKVSRDGRCWKILSCLFLLHGNKNLSHDFPVTVLKMSVINICGSKSAKPELSLSSGIRASFRTLFWFHSRYLHGSGFLFE